MLVLSDLVVIWLLTDAFFLSSYKKTASLCIFLFSVIRARAFEFFACIVSFLFLFFLSPCLVAATGVHVSSLPNLPTYLPRIYLPTYRGFNYLPTESLSVHSSLLFLMTSAFRDYYHYYHFFFIKCMQSMTMTLSRRCVYVKLHVICLKSMLYIFERVSRS